MFKFSDESQKLKTQLLTLSGVCLFIAITGVLPEKVAIIGLDLSSSKNVSGWFLLTVSAFFLVKFGFLAGFEVTKKILPKIIEFKNRNITGDIVGLTEQEIYSEYEKGAYEDENNDVGGLAGELKEINHKKKIVEIRYNSNFEKLYNCWIYSIDFLFPVVFSIFSIYALYIFLSTGEVTKFT